MEKHGKYTYLTGFGNNFATEAIPGSLPHAQNSPQVCPKGLYAEQLSGTAFTVPRLQNQKVWLYRIRPSVCHSAQVEIPARRLTNDFSSCKPDPSQMRWDPLAEPKEPVDFIESLVTYCGAGDPSSKTGMAVHLYNTNKDMVDRCFYNSDGDFLIVPFHGKLDIQTELGWLEVGPGEICVIQRGICFAVRLPDGKAAGYVAEVYDGHFIIPDLGPIGSNGLANPRDFLTPVAAFENRQNIAYTKVTKFLGTLWEAKLEHSPFDVVAWHGNYAPYKYELSRFAAVNTVTFDHPDPSIFTVLTCPSGAPGVACCDFVWFPSRWAVGEHTFRPPWFHRNCMSEYMGLVKGIYEAKAEGFVPGGGSLHSCMTPHGPDRATFDKHSAIELKPHYIEQYAFMFESTYIFRVTDFAKEHKQANYHQVWANIESHFKE